MLTANTTVGDVVLQNLTLARGPNSVNAVAQFDPNGSEAGKQLLASFLGGQNASVNIQGFNGSTNIVSLNGGLSQIRLGSTLPGLQSKLVNSTNLVVLPDTAATSIAQTYVTINNPFSAGLNIVKINAAVTYSGMPVGNIIVDISSNPIVVSGKASASSSALPITLNVDPTAIALLLRENAQNSGLDLKPLDGLLNMGGIKIGDTSVTPSTDLFKGFDLVSFVQKAMANLRIDLVMEATVGIGQYSTLLAYNQSSIPCKTGQISP
ncbi:hypothetical protein BC938DRAFT_481562 [Jimgerdemannia flammicorona]|uniref:Uncharacterized protein n=1 Tax=Jimgerdemannia flammicorona TaxID=994334 RepID=A0A433QGI3_9FUNG|nr:hypothetical protein BC938DRAFT_481562 [Jimgerdemannia flammicorona]